MTPTCCKVPAFLLLFCWISIVPGLAEIVPVSVSQQVSGSGDATACDPGCQMLYQVQYDGGNSFSFANSNMQLPTTNLSQDGNATDSFETGYPRSASVDASASQTSTLTPASINLHLFVSGDLSGSSTLMSGDVSANSGYSLVFDLNGPFLVDLTGGINGGTSSSFSGIGSLNGSFDGEIHLTGAGVQFDEVLAFPFGSGFNGQAFDQFVTLGPGQYTLAAVADLTGQGSYFLDSNSFFDLSLNADFTPAIPEPAHVSIFLGLLTMAGLFFARRQAAAGFR